MNAVTIRNLSFRYHSGSEVFSNLNLVVPKNTISVLSGDNGSGKTTLLYLICGIIPRAIHGTMKGQILLNDTDYANEPLSQLAPVISILMQEIEWQLHFPTVEQEIIFGPENLCLPVEEIRKRLDDSLAFFRIENLRQEDTHTLSVGQKRLVALASLYALRPSILALDEPLNGLSEESMGIVMDFIRTYREKYGTVILTAHQKEALDIADQVTDLNAIRGTQ